MSYASPLSICRPASTQTTSSTKPVYPAVSMVKTARCCETGRPVMIDPVTGRTICSCQVKSSAAAYMSRVPTLPEAVYGNTSGAVFQPNVVVGNDPSSAFYSMGLKVDRTGDNVTSATPSGASPYYLEHLMATHPYNAFYPGFDFNNARRKNATRETTSALKAWLYEHRKNPYPTKGEKIMLAIITRMTLTQVSTWFANARRRLKKENKIDDKDDSLCEIDLEDKSDTGHLSCDLSSNDEDKDSFKHPTDLSDISDTEDPFPEKLSTLSSSNKLYTAEHLHKDLQEHFPKNFHDHIKESNKIDNKRHVSNYVIDIPNGKSLNKPEASAPCDNSASGKEVAPSRPKIWSISEIISSDTNSSSNSS